MRNLHDDTYRSLQYIWEEKPGDTSIWQWYFGTRSKQQCGKPRKLWMSGPNCQCWGQIEQAHTEILQGAHRGRRGYRKLEYRVFQNSVQNWPLVHIRSFKDRPKAENGGHYAVRSWNLIWPLESTIWRMPWPPWQPQMYEQASISGSISSVWMLPKIIPMSNWSFSEASSCVRKLTTPGHPRSPAGRCINSSRQIDRDGE